MSENVTHLPSIQGEQTSDPGPASYMTEGEVDAYVDNHSDGIVECRMERRHVYERPRRGSVTFVDVDSDGFLIALFECKRCRCAYRRERWEAIKRGRQVRYYRIDATTVYRQAPDGEVYTLPPGMGRMNPRAVRESVMTAALSGQSVAALMKAARQRAADD